MDRWEGGREGIGENERQTEGRRELDEQRGDGREEGG